MNSFKDHTVIKNICCVETWAGILLATREIYRGKQAVSTKKRIEAFAYPVAYLNLHDKLCWRIDLAAFHTQVIA